MKNLDIMYCITVIKRGRIMSEENKGFFSRLKAGLTKTRDNIVKGIDSVFSGFSNNFSISFAIST